jgi:TPR repeat protein/tRNA A-37 threonylcarbamoyl transferase component Bud32
MDLVPEQLQRLFTPIEGYQVQDLIGKGTSAAVHRAIKLATNEAVALKLFRTAFDDGISRRQFLREIEMMALLRHPTILGLRGFSFPTDAKSEGASIAMDLMPNGSLLDVLLHESQGTAPPEWTPTKKLISIFGIAAGMAFIHQQGGIHRDLKPANVLLDANFEPHISDFGLAKITETDVMQSIFGGTPLWMAPELFESEQYTNSVDVFAYGMIVFQIVTGLLPFGGNKTRIQLSLLVSRGERPGIPLTVSYFFTQLITECWEQDPRRRPTFSVIIDRLLSDDRFLPGVQGDVYREYQKRVWRSGGSISPVSPPSPVRERALAGEPQAMFEYSMDLFQRGRMTEAVVMLVNAANAGHTDAQLRTANLYSSGQFVPKNETQAAVFFKLAADAGNAYATFQCGEILALGRGVAPNMAKAERYWRDAAALNYPPAMLRLGGHVERENPREAVSLYKRAADLGLIDAAAAAGQLLERLGDADAIRYYQIAAEGGDFQSMSALGRLAASPPAVPEEFVDLAKRADGGDAASCERLAKLLYEVCEYRKSAYFLKKAALGGSSEAAFQCAKFLFDGIGVQRDDFKAAYFCKLAADEGHNEAMFQFAHLLAAGRGVPLDFARANAALVAAADRGHLQSQLAIAYNADNGVGIAVDPATAVRYYGMAADQNSTVALLNLGSMASVGRGMEANPALSVSFYEKAARLGDSVGQFNYGVALHNGAGITKNLKEAAKWYKLSADQGYVEAMCNYAIVISGGGPGIAKNLGEAKRYAEHAAEAGNATGQCVYAQLLVLLDGNTEDAVRYFRMSAAQGNARATRKLQEMGIPI